MAEQRPFGRRGTAPERRAPVKTRAAQSPEASVLPDGAEMVARARKRTIGLSLATAGALTAAGLWFAESSDRVCVDDPATTTVDESKVGDCATSTRHHGGSLWGGRWFWRGGSSWGGSTMRSSPSASIAPVAAKSTASRGGFGSIGSFHLFGGS